jgi:hypothetical protein
MAAPYTSEPTAQVYDTMLTSTMNKFLTNDVADQVNKANIVFYTLNKPEFKKPWTGGERIEVPLRVLKSTSGGWYDDSEPLNTNPSNPLSKAFFPIHQIHYSVVLSRLEEQKNRGEARAINMLQALSDDAEDSLVEDMNTAVCGSGATDYRRICGVVDFIQEDPTCATGGRNGDGYVGGISQVSNTWWRNKVVQNKGTAFTYTPDLGDTPANPTAWVALEKLFENCSKGGGSKQKKEPNIGLCNQPFFQLYLTGIAPQRRYQSSEYADAGFRNILFNGMPISWDEMVASPSAVVSGTVACCYFLNKYYMHLCVDPETDMLVTPFVRPANQDARISQILWYGALGCSSRRKLGIFVDAHITPTDDTYAGDQP